MVTNQTYTCINFDVVTIYSFYKKEQALLLHINTSFHYKSSLLKVKIQNNTRANLQKNIGVN